MLLSYSIFKQGKEDATPAICVCTFVKNGGKWSRWKHEKTRRDDTILLLFVCVLLFAAWTKGDGKMGRGMDHGWMIGAGTRICRNSSLPLISSPLDEGRGRGPCEITDFTHSYIVQYFLFSCLLEFGSVSYLPVLRKNMWFEIVSY